MAGDIVDIQSWQQMSSKHEKTSGLIPRWNLTWKLEWRRSIPNENPKEWRVAILLTRRVSKDEMEEVSAMYCSWYQAKSVIIVYTMNHCLLPSLVNSRSSLRFHFGPKRQPEELFQEDGGGCINTPYTPSLYAARRFARILDEQCSIADVFLARYFNSLGHPTSCMVYCI